MLRINIQDCTDPDGKNESATNAIIGISTLEQRKSRSADLEGKAKSPQVSFRLRPAALIEP